MGAWKLSGPSAVVEGGGRFWNVLTFLEALVLRAAWAGREGQQVHGGLDALLEGTGSQASSGGP